MVKTTKTTRKKQLKPELKLVPLVFILMILITLSFIFVDKGVFNITGRAVGNTPSMPIIPPVDNIIIDYNETPLGNIDNFTLTASNTNGVIATVSFKGEITPAHTEQDLLDNIDFGLNYFYLNSVVLSELNIPATITFNVPPEMYPNYTLQATPTILVDGIVCNDCENISFNGTVLSFDVVHFSNYSYTPSTYLEIWDDSDTTTIESGDNLTFYANYSGVFNGTSIVNATCSISIESQFEVPQTATMIYDNGLYKYRIETVNPNIGTWKYQIECSATGYDTISLKDSYEVIPGPINPSCGDTITSSAKLGSDLSCSGDALILSGDDITFNCNGYTITSTDGAGIILNQVDNLELINCNIKDSYQGIVIKGATNSKIHDNNITNTTTTAIKSEFALQSNSGNEIYSNNIKIADKGIELDCSGTSYRIYNNFIEAMTSSSISASSSDFEACSVIDNLKIYDNEISGVDVSTYNFGIYLDGVKNSEIYNNIIHDSVSSHPSEKTSSVFVSNSNGITNINNNTLVGFDYGVTVYQNDYPVEVDDNSFSSLYIGSVLIHTSSNVNISGNSFYNTDYHIETNTASNITIENNTFDVAEYNFIYSYLTDNLKINDNTFNSNSGNTDTVTGYDIYLDDDITNLEIYDNSFNPKIGAILHANSGYGDFDNVLIYDNSIISGGASTAINLTTGGVAISPSGNLIKENEISGFTNAIKIKNINNVVLEDNYIESNTNGLILDNADNTQFIGNWFCTNANDLNLGASTGLFGDNNSCENPGTWNDDSSASGCSYQCAVCSMSVTKGIRMGKNLSCVEDGFHIAEDNITIDCNGHSIIGDGGTGNWTNPDFGISPTFGVGTHNNAEIKNCVIKNFDLGIGVSGTDIDNIWVHNSTFVNNNLSGIMIETGLNPLIEYNSFIKDDAEGSGITLVLNSNNATIKNNMFSILNTPIVLDTLSGTTIKYNIFNDVGIPVYLTKTNSSEIYENNIINSYMGVIVEENSENNLIRDNNFEGLGVYPDAMGLTYKQGIRINSSDNNIILGNTFTDFDDHSIQILNSKQINITNNTIENTKGNGVYLEDSSNCFLDNNHFEQNLKGIYLLRTTNTTTKDNYFFNNSQQSIFINIGESLYFENNIMENTGGGYSLWDTINSKFYGGIINSTEPYAGISLYRSHGNIFEDIYQRNAQQAATNGQDGMYIQSSQNNTFVNITSVENGHHSLIFSVEAGTGLDTSGNQFIGCNFSNNGFRGVVFALINYGGTENVVNNIIQDSTISNNGDYGITYYYNDRGGYTGTKIIGNTIESNGLEGVNMKGSNLEIKNNIIKDNGGDYGIYITSANYSVIDSNEIVGSVVGIGIDKKTIETNITNNILVNNTYGIGAQGTFDESNPGEDISNLRIYGNNILSGDFGIILQYAQQLEIKDNIISGLEYGLSLDTVDYANINYNDIYDVDYGFDVSLDYSNISMNNITSRFKDITLTSSNHNKIFNNIDAPYEEVIGEDNYGLVLIGSSNNEIYNNLLNNHKGGDAVPSQGYVGDYYGGSSYALYLENSHSNTIYSNQINNNTGGEGETEPGKGHGIYLNQSNSNYLYDNELQYNEYAIYVKNGASNSFEDNFIRFNDYAMKVDNSQLGNLVGNIMCRNRKYNLYGESSSISTKSNNYCENINLWNGTNISCANRIFNASKNAILPDGIELVPDVPNLAIADYDFGFNITYDHTGWTEYSVQVSNNFGDYINLTPISSHFDETTGDTIYYFKETDEDTDYKIIKITAINPCYNETHKYAKYKLELKKPTTTSVNLITLPVEVEKVDIDNEKQETTFSTIPAEEFGQKHQTTSGLPWLDYISEWVPSLQQYRGHPVGFESITPLTMEPGKPYFISVREPTNITLYGWIPPHRDFNVGITTLVVGNTTYVTGRYNFITLPLDTELKTGYDLCLDLIEKGISDGNTQIEVWNEVEQEYVVTVESMCSQIIADYGSPFGENFDLIPGKTYRFAASTEGTWTQK